MNLLTTSSIYPPPPSPPPSTVLAMAESAREVGVAVAAGVVVLSSLLWLLRWLNEWRFTRGIRHRLPPGSMGWPVIGEMIDFLWYFKFARRPDDFIAKRKARYGDTGIYKTHLFGHPSIITCSPELNKIVFTGTHNEGNFHSGWPTYDLMGTKSVAVAEGMLHKKLRRHLLEMFSSPKSRDFHLSTAQPVIISALEGWITKHKIVAHMEARALTFRNICDVLISYKSDEFLETMETLYRGLMAGVRSMTIKLPGTAFYHALKCREKLMAILFNETRERKQQGIQKHDFMQILMDSVDEDGTKLTEVEIVENIVSLVLGGFESTSNVITWALCYLAKYPAVLEKLKDETRSIRKDRPKSELLTAEDIKMFNYTSKVADEAIRLANVSAFAFRTTVKDEVVFNGYLFPKNWKVISWIRANHEDARYFKNPSEFNPDRWDEAKPKAGVLQVFGSGPRNCPGNNFAKLQVMLFLHHVCLHYRWELLNPDAGVKYLPNPRAVDGLEMIFTQAD